MKAGILVLLFSLVTSISAQGTFQINMPGDIPDDLPMPKVTVSKNPSPGYLFASVPYWGNGNSYLVIYSNAGSPIFYRKMKITCTDFKLQENGLFTYFDYSTKKFYALDSTMAVVDSFWVKNGYTTDEHDIKFLKNGNVLLIGLDYKLVDMSNYIVGGNRNASVVLNVIQEIDKNKNVVFEWKSEDHYKYTDAGSGVNLLDQAFVHSHINSIDVDLDGNIIISTRNLNEISKINRKNGDFIWRFGGKNNQFIFLRDSLGFNLQHSAVVLKNGNLLVYDNGLEHSPKFSRVIEYKINESAKTTEAVWSYRNSPDVISTYWGNAQRLLNGNTFISWGMNKIAATEVNSNNEKVFEMEFLQNVYSYRIFKHTINIQNITSEVSSDRITEKFKLEQNYPNPFNPNTVISYQLAVPSQVCLKVYNLIGQEVATLVNEYKNPGIYSSQFSILNLSDSSQRTKLSSGIYFYVLRTGNFASTRKMLLLK